MFGMEVEYLFSLDVEKEPICYPQAQVDSPFLPILYRFLEQISSDSDQKILIVPLRLDLVVNCIVIELPGSIEVASVLVVELS